MNRSFFNAALVFVSASVMGLSACSGLTLPRELTDTLAALPALTEGAWRMYTGALAVCGKLPTEAGRESCTADVKRAAAPFLSAWCRIQPESEICG